MVEPPGGLRPRDGQALIYLANVRTGSSHTIAALAEAVGSHRLFHLTGGDPGAPGTIEDFQRVADTGQHRVFAGHFPFGVHRMVGRPCVYVTAVRDPVDRVLSQYTSIRESFDGTPDIRRWLAAFPEANNGMVRRLSGVTQVPGRTIPFNALNGCWESAEPLTLMAADLRRAVGFLDAHFAAVLLVERQAESLVLLERITGLRPLFTIRPQNTNRSHRPVKRRDVAPDIIDEIAARNRLDACLYRLCRRRFQARVSEQGEAFRADAEVMSNTLGIVAAAGARSDGSPAHRVLASLWSAINEWIAAGDVAMAVAVLRRFLARRDVGQAFCDAGLRLIADLGQITALDEELAAYRRRFGDEKIVAILKRVGRL